MGRFDYSNAILRLNIGIYGLIPFFLETKPYFAIVVVSK